MSGWKDFEKECLNWLKNQFGELALFELRGGYNSNESDIKVTSLKGVSFYIEVKSPVSQCSQFVLIPDVKSNRFIYSKRNKLKMNPFTQSLIDYMDLHFEEYKEPTTAGVNLIPNLAQAMGHIRYQHMVKGVEFFISKNNLGYIIIPLSLISYYFDTDTVYRRKKSGSSHISTKKDSEIFDWIFENYSIRCFRSDNRVFAPLDDSLVKKEFKINDKSYMFKEVENEKFMELRGHASTNNPNIIFTINIKNDVEGLPDDFFKHFLELLNR